MDVKAALGNIASASDGRPWRDRALKQAIDDLPDDDSSKKILEEINFALETIQGKFLNIYLATAEFSPSTDFTRLMSLRPPASDSSRSLHEERERYDALHRYTLQLEAVVSERYQERTRVAELALTEAKRLSQGLRME